MHATLAIVVFDTLQVNVLQVKEEKAVVRADSQDVTNMTDLELSFVINEVSKLEVGRGFKDARDWGLALLSRKKDFYC